LRVFDIANSGQSLSWCCFKSGEHRNRIELDLSLRVAVPVKEPYLMKTMESEMSGNHPPAMGCMRKFLKSAFSHHECARLLTI